MERTSAFEETNASLLFKAQTLFGDVAADTRTGVRRKSANKASVSAKSLPREGRDLGSKIRTFLEKENVSGNQSNRMETTDTMEKATVPKGKLVKGRQEAPAPAPAPPEQEEMAESVRHLEALVGYQEAFLEELMDELESLYMEKEQRETNIRETKGKIEAIDNELGEINQKYSTEIDKLLEESQRLQFECDNLRAFHTEEEGRHEALRGEVDGARRLLDSKQRESDDLQRMIQAEEYKIKEKQSHLELIMRTLEHYSRVEEDMERDIKDIIEKKKILNNELQELKGNIRVYLRIRPQRDEIPPQGYFLNIENYNKLEVNVPLQFLKSENNTKEFKFSFDHIFDQMATQEDVFNELAQLVQSALDGYHVCILAYGQTGSGKTYTMIGDDVDYSRRGVIQRAVEHVVEQIAILKKYGWEYKLYVNFRELYLDQVRDLLKNQVIFDNELSLVAVDNAQDVFCLLQQANENRKVAETECNEHSSRSHCIFHLRIKGVCAETGKASEGSLSLVDLAGSERISMSKVDGDRLKETQFINKSLTALGDVITALANKEKFIPYRNSKLTMLLQNFFGGDSKTLMFVNISPVVANYHQTISSLRFASKVKECENGGNRGMPRRQGNVPGQPPQPQPNGQMQQPGMPPQGQGIPPQGPGMGPPQGQGMGPQGQGMPPPPQHLPTHMNPHQSLYPPQPMNQQQGGNQPMYPQPPQMRPPPMYQQQMHPQQSHPPHQQQMYPPQMRR